MELYELQELRTQINRPLCTMISNDDESKAHDDIINNLSRAQSILDTLIATEQAKTVIYYKVVQKGYDSICEDLDFCRDSENDDDVFGIECDEHGVIKLGADDYLAIGGSEECITDRLEPHFNADGTCRTDDYEDGKPEWMDTIRYVGV